MGETLSAKGVLAKLLPPKQRKASNVCLQLPASLATTSDAPESSTKKRKGFGRPTDALIWIHFDRIEQNSSTECMHSIKWSHWNALHSHRSAVTAMPVCFAM